MNIFLSYPSEERTAAEEIQFALLEAGHEVFFDRKDLPPGAEYHQRIHDWIGAADLFIFLITPQSVAAGRYSLTELGLAQERWPHPKNHVLPVMLRTTPYADIPAYLKAVTVEQPKGNVAAEVLAAVEKLQALQDAAPVSPANRKRLLAGLGGAALAAAATVAYFQFAGGEDPAKPALAVPSPIQIRFAYKAAGSSAVELEGALLRADVQVNRRVFSENLAPQDGGFFSLNTAFPDEGSRIEGTVTRPVRRSALGAAPPPALLCLRRPNPLQAFEDAFVQVDCDEGAPCQLHKTSPRWLEACETEAAKTSQAPPPFGLFAEARAEATARQWTVPSARTLAANEATMAGVGYTVIDLETDAFRDPQVYAVEVGIRVNGVPLLEDGLAPAQRPVPNDATQPFHYRFAMEPLNFSGEHAGCEAVQLTLRPRMASGKTGAPLQAMLAYVALRSKESATVPLGATTLRWSARYLPPPREWSHEAFIASVPYAASGGPAAAAAAREAVLRMKRAIDELQLKHEGQPLVAVIRPPLEHGTGQYAFGVTAGIVVPSGQVRFTFPPEQAAAVAATLGAARAASAKARALIAQKPYVYRVMGNTERREAQTPPGVCGPIAKE